MRTTQRMRSRKKQQVNKETKTDLLDAARNLFENLQADIENASTRIEHIRLTTLAQEAENLYIQILNFTNGEDSAEINF